MADVLVGSLNPIPEPGQQGLGSLLQPSGSSVSNYQEHCPSPASWSIPVLNRQAVKLSGAGVTNLVFGSGIAGYLC